MKDILNVNAQLSPSNDLLLQDLGQRLGLNLDMPDGALRLTTAAGQAWFLEITADGGAWIIHAAIMTCSHATPAMLDAWLRLNGQIERMQGAAICIEDRSNTVRLYNTIRTENLDIHLVEDTLAHMLQLHDELSDPVAGGRPH